MNMKKIITLGLLAFLVLAGVILIKTLTFNFQEIKTIKNSSTMEHPRNEDAIKRLSQAIQIPTVSTVNYEETNFKPFDDFKEFLKNTYPRVYQQMDTTTVNTYGLVFHWKGKDSSKKPLLFLSHYDVVPINNYDFEANPKPSETKMDFTAKSEPLKEFQHSWDGYPFSGDIKNGRIYGRGTLDMKAMLISIFEAANTLLEQGFVPNQDIYFAFGHDEEVSGLQGAVHIAEYFNKKGIRFDAVYDEGGIVTSPGSILPQVDKAIALIGVAEKGFLTLEITVKGIGGHSSMPPAKGSLVLAAEIIEKLNSNQMPAMLIPPIENFLYNIGSTMDFKSRMAIANTWLLKSTLLTSLEKNPASNALVRTTTAITMAHSSDATNVLSASTKVTANFRILQGNTVEDVLNHVKKLCEGYDVEFNIVSSREPSRLSSHTTDQYKKLQEIIAINYPEAIVTPYLSIGGTDAYKYELVSDNVFRFMPIEINQYEQRQIHNDNESITIDNYMKMINHFKLLMEQ